MYEVWMTQGQGGVMVEEFPDLESAIEYCKPRMGVDGSYAIKYPTGEYHEWSKDK
jgi:hypothetical protein